MVNKSSILSYLCFFLVGIHVHIFRNISVLLSYKMVSFVNFSIFVYIKQQSKISSINNIYRRHSVGISNILKQIFINNSIKSVVLNDYCLLVSMVIYLIRYLVINTKHSCIFHQSID